MKPDLLEILRCPVCRSELTLTTRKKDGADIIEGSLHCAKCPADYPISDGIPDLVPPPQRA